MGSLRTSSPSLLLLLQLPKPSSFLSPSQSQCPPVSFSFRNRIRIRRNKGTLFAAAAASNSNNNNNGDDDDDDDDDDDSASAAAAAAAAAAANPNSNPYEILGVDPTTSPSPAQLKAAFRARVKQFHPDVCNDIPDADSIILRVIRAYKILSKRHHHEETEGACLDPFEEPECEANDLFVNEVLCIGKGCPYSCVERAPYALSFTAENGTACATSQGHSDDYRVQLAVGQCPKRCIHYVTPSQRAVLEDLLDSVLSNPYNMGDAALLESLIIKAAFENNRYQKPKRRPKVSTEYVDWC